MDLTTTAVIKRRSLDILPNSNTLLTPCQIKVSNWMQNKNLSNYKIRISSFYLNNSTIACFIPLYTDSISPTSVYNDLTPATPVAYATGYDVLNVNTLGYRVAIKKKAAPYNITVGYVYMSPLLSEYPSNIPATRPNSPYSQYANNYYSFYDTSKFGEAVSATLSALFTSVAELDFVEIIKTSTGYQMLVSQQALLTYDVLIDNELANLYKFKMDPSTDSSVLRKMVFNTQTIIYNTIICSASPTRHVPDTWFPYDAIIFKTSAPIETETFYTSNNYIPQNYDDIMLSFDSHTNDPDGIYNFYKSEISANSGWCSLRDSNTSENLTFSIYVRLRRTGDLLPYTITIGEQANMVIETLITN